MSPELSKTYIVLPFRRVGATVGAQQAVIFDHPQKAASFANSIGGQVSGIAILERSFDPETGDSTDRLIARAGAVPPQFPEAHDWTLRLN